MGNLSCDWGLAMALISGAMAYPSMAAANPFDDVDTSSAADWSQTSSTADLASMVQAESWQNSEPEGEPEPPPSDLEQYDEAAEADSYDSSPEETTSHETTPPESKLKAASGAYLNYHYLLGYHAMNNTKYHEFGAGIGLRLLANALPPLDGGTQLAFAVGSDYLPIFGVSSGGAAFRMQLTANAALGFSSFWGVDKKTLKQRGFMMFLGTFAGVDLLVTHGGGQRPVYGGFGTMEFPSWDAESGRFSTQLIRIEAMVGRGPMNVGFSYIATF